MRCRLSVVLSLSVIVSCSFAIANLAQKSSDVSVGENVPVDLMNYYRFTSVSRC